MKWMKDWIKHKNISHEGRAVGEELVGPAALEAASTHNAKSRGGVYLFDSQGSGQIVYTL